MMKTKQLFYLSAIALASTITSCEKEITEPELPTTIIPTSYNDGVFIVNQGGFGKGNGSINFYSRSKKEVSSDDIFYGVNIYALGDVAQSMELYNGKGYIVVNNSQKIEVVDATSFKTKGVISNLALPRYFLGVNNTTGYVSQWGDGFTGTVQVINLSNNTISSTISTGKGAEAMVKVGDKVYVACSGGFGTDSVVAVIDTKTNTVVKNIVVGVNPLSLQIDANGNVWALCKGSMDYSVTPAQVKHTGQLSCIDITADTVKTKLPFTTTLSDSPLAINKAKNTLYYCYNSKTFSHTISATTLSSTEFINRDFYSIAVDPLTDYLYGADAGNFASKGKVIRYNATGTLIDEFSVGIIPGNFCFK